MSYQRRRSSKARARRRSSPQEEGRFLCFENNSLYYNKRCERPNLGKYFTTFFRLDRLRSPLSRQAATPGDETQLLGGEFVTITALVHAQADFGGDFDPRFFFEPAEPEDAVFLLGHGCLEVDDRELKPFENLKSFANELRPVLGTMNQRRGLDRFGSMTPLVGARSSATLRTTIRSQAISPSGPPSIGKRRGSTRMWIHVSCQSSTVTSERMNRARTHGSGDPGLGD